MPPTTATAGANHGTGANFAARLEAVPGFRRISVDLPLCIAEYDISRLRQKASRVNTEPGGVKYDCDARGRFCYRFASPLCII